MNAQCCVCSCLFPAGIQAFLKEHIFKIEGAGAAGEEEDGEEGAEEGAEEEDR